MFLDSVLHTVGLAVLLADVDFTAFTRNPVNHAILFSRVNSIFWPNCSRSM